MTEGLPPDGALTRAAAGHHWTHLDYSTADTRDLVEMLLVAFVNANRPEKQPAVPYPKPSWRPGDPLPEETAAADEERDAKARAAYRRIVDQVKGADHAR